MKTFTLQSRKNIVKAVFSTVLMIAAGSAMAQNNTFPTSGNVGIGTTSPVSKLHVVGNTGLTPFQVESSGSGTYVFFANKNQEGDGGTIGMFFQNKSNTFLQAIDNKGDLALTGSGNGTILKMTKNGQMGIGTGTPMATTKLHILGAGTVGLTPLTVESAETTTFVKVFNSNATARNVGVQLQNKLGTFQQFMNASGHITFQTASNQIPLFLSNQGNVGIGTTTLNPTFKLMVNGAVRAKEVVVETGWADFVFEDTYRLTPLEEVEQYVKKHKHLAEIPSAKEVEENGVNLGTMESKLLQKVEELTLYLIEANKQIKTLESRIVSLEATPDTK